ncbi:electron transporter [Streptomyces agglomeratus]|uniref:DM13 domain-containing protein n=1 Tax=Streptomyces agglomeratus TaxID=285458 RepID=UPI000854D1B5|nr:DM13 domain-containing protein [Streptomyces agglomeratus]OEJ40020.1 electron transporter [Streptomyces agglomeratus]OEJ45598.1 electron transporter [Streptomyces agglomeratus]
MRRILGKPVVIASTLVGVFMACVGLYWFQPWKLWVDDTVRDELPAAAPATQPDAVPDAPSGTANPSDKPRSSAPPTLLTLASGSLISHEHSTSGTAEIIRLPDGSRTLRLENLDTSNGPDLRVWLTDAPVKEGKDGWHVFDDGKYVSLGKLKGNKGDQNYALPADLDLKGLTSVSIWCDRFDVSFGAAELTAPA